LWAAATYLLIEHPPNTFSEMSDAELIRAARRQPAAFEELFERHALVLRQWLFAQTGDAGVANDLLAETFAQAWRGVRRFRGEDERSGAAWLYGIARHLVHQHYKRGRIETAGRRRLGMASLASDEGGIDEMLGRIDAHELSPAVREAFAGLTAEQQAAIGYRVIDELSYEEIGERLRCTPGSARGRVFRGLQTMRSTIAKGARS
jgi:RNA polymerase sigma-70 factor (ECF subfamily)